MTRYSTTRRLRFKLLRSCVRWSRHPAGRNGRRENPPEAYRNRQTLLSRGETAFFGPLTHAVAGQFLIMCKVRLADVITCSDADWRRGMGAAIAQKHLDFVLCDLRSTRYVLAIELDDRSHAQYHRRRRDRFVNEALSQARIRLVRFRASAHYSVKSIRDCIFHEIRREASGGMNRFWLATWRLQIF